MNLLPAQADPYHGVGRASELAAAVLPPARARGSASAEEQAGRSTAELAVDQLEREQLMTHFVESAGQRREVAGQGLRAQGGGCLQPCLGGRST